MDAININTENKKIAKFLGWYQLDESTTLYYKDYELGKIIVHDTTQFNDLPFHRDWNYLMEVVRQLEDMGLCFHTANFCKSKNVKDNLNAHIGFDLGNEDYYCDISGSIIENDIQRFFNIQRLDTERIVSVYRTIVMFIDAYNDKTIRIMNICNNKIVRTEKI